MKSAIAVWLASTGSLPTDPEASHQLAYLRSQVGATHFCIAASGSPDPRNLAKCIAEQLNQTIKLLGNKVKSGETKIRHFPNPYVMELVAGSIPKIKYGDRIGEKLQRLGDRLTETLDCLLQDILTS